MLKQLFLMPYSQGQFKALSEQGTKLVKFLTDELMADEIPPHITILCSSSPQAKKIAEIIAANFSISRWAIPIESTGGFDDYGYNSPSELDNQALKEIEAAMLQNSVVLVVTDPLRIEGISKALGQNIKLKNAECLIFERQQLLTEKSGSLTLTGRLAVNDPIPSSRAAQLKKVIPPHFFQNDMTSRNLRTAALVSAASFAALGITAEVDGHFGLSGITDMEVVAGQKQPSVHIPLPWDHTKNHQVKLAYQAGKEQKKVLFDEN